MIWIVGLIIIGLAAGIFGGALGIGGAVIIIPVLVYGFGMDQKIAQGTTLLMMLPPIGLLAALEYLRRGQANWTAAMWLALGFLAGGLIGARLVTEIPSSMLKRIFGMLIILIGLKMVIKP